MAGAPLGNQNGAKGKRWRDAIDRALARRGKGEMVKAMDELADDYLDKVAGANGMDGYREFGDRYDGKPAQQVNIAGHDGQQFVVKFDSADENA